MPRTVQRKGEKRGGEKAFLAGAVLYLADWIERRRGAGKRGKGAKKGGNNVLAFRSRSSPLFSHTLRMRRKREKERRSAKRKKRRRKARRPPWLLVSCSPPAAVGSGEGLKKKSR